MGQRYLTILCALLLVGYCHSGVITNSEKVSFTYTLWVGTDVTEIYTLNLEAPSGSTFYQAMEIAAETDPNFKFGADFHQQWGHYIHTIAGHKDDNVGHYYWMLYILPERPDPANKPGDELLSAFGVDSLIVEDGGNYLFWYVHNPPPWSFEESD